MEGTLTVLRGRTSDRSEWGRLGAEELAAALARRLGAGVEHVGEPGEPRVQGYAEDLRDGRAAFADAAAAADRERPALFASQCSIALATLPVVARREPDATVVWLDAHGDFNTPDTSGSGYLGGMPLAAACGLWDAGWGAGVEPARVVLSDARDLDPAERELLVAAGVRVVAPAAVPDAVRGARVFLHLDVDILDPEVLPGSVPAPGGIGLEDLRALLAGLASAATVIGLEVTAFDAPDRAELVGPIAAALSPLLVMK